ncbi:MAG: hypothetical protein FWH47_01485 [Methanomassiliicoccaceae archaeon]|nr:hypothetical protein [Methanomassiliicoccaceae archaeon]
MGEEGILTDDVVREIINERKYLADWPIDLKKLKAEKNSRHLRMEVPLDCQKYPCRVAIRQSVDRPTNFSVILIYRNRNGDHTIVRYNGYHGEHKNKFTGETIYGPHIHKLTELYQRLTDKPEGYAVATNAYVDIYGAVNVFVTDMNISIKPPAKNRTLEGWE